MSRITPLSDNFPLAMQNMVRQMARSWHMEEAYFDSMFKPRLTLIDPSFSQSSDAMTHRFTDALLARDMAPDGMDVHVDVVERNGAYKVQADLPGMKKEDINVSIDGNVVSIRARTQSASEQKDGKVLFSERHCGEVSRTFTLEQEVDESKATGKYADGVLMLELPKKAQQPKHEMKSIAIQ
jgi:HSP20 family protein